MKNLIAALALLTGAWVGACAGDEPPRAHQSAETASTAHADDSTAAADPSNYTLDAPDRSFALPDELRETSGLAVMPDGRLATIQDEEGIVYILNRESGTLEARWPFAEAGDYEGIEWVGDRGFVLRADGTVFELSGGADEIRTERTHQTSLKAKNDTEGLGYDAAGGRLLIACKEDPGDGVGKNRRAIYAFDFDGGELSTEPAFVLDEEEIEQALGDGGGFKPSAVAIHPTTGDVYVLSATARAIAVLHGDGSLKAAHPLSKDLFEQPEGLAFLDDGTMYISSEGDKSPPMLFEFRPGGAE